MPRKEIKAFVWGPEFCATNTRAREYLALVVGIVLMDFWATVWKKPVCFDPLSPAIKR